MKKKNSVNHQYKGRNFYHRMCNSDMGWGAHQFSVLSLSLCHALKLRQKIGIN